MGRGVNHYALQIKHKLLLSHRFCAKAASDLIPMTEHYAMEEYKGIEVTYSAFLNSTLKEDSQLSAPANFDSNKKH
jgi:hypothetical protein